MIVGGKIERVEADKKSDGKIEGLSINITLDDIKVKDENLEINYTYSAKYEKGVGEIKIIGVLYAKEDKKTAKEISEIWKKEKTARKLPMEYTSALISAINYTGSANGTLVARVLNLSPPLVPPKLQLESEPKK
ncbi:MAG: hypothetical protein PHU63_04530 [Candidatus ainarchaeum sp.]|nr:hypothetical protein [Candidatus ainarchaeum sp.]